MFHNGTHTQLNNATGSLYITNSTTDGSVRISATSGHQGVSVHYEGAVDLYHNNTKRFATSDSGVEITGDLETTSDVKVGSGITALSDGNVSIGGTFEIFESSGTANRNFSQFKLSNFSIGQHQNTGTYKIINSSTGHLLLGGGIGGNGGIVLYNNSLGAKYLRANSEGSVEIFHDNTLHFETSGIGATVFGQLDTTSNVAVGSGVTLSSDGDGFYTGIVTASSFVGGLPITNGADNRVITATSASAIQGESGLTFDGTTLTNAGSGFKGITIAPNTNNSATLRLQNSQANFSVSNITG